MDRLLWPHKLATVADLRASLEKLTTAYPKIKDFFFLHLEFGILSCTESMEITYADKQLVFTGNGGLGGNTFTVNDVMTLLNKPVEGRGDDFPNFCICHQEIQLITKSSRITIDMEKNQIILS